MRKSYTLRIIIENQKSPDKTKKLAILIADTLAISNQAIISAYEKFPNSFQIVFEGELIETVDQISQAIEITDRICSPWLVNYNRDNQEISLLFNKSESAAFRNQHFNVIRWANFEMD